MNKTLGYTLYNPCSLLLTPTICTTDGEVYRDIKMAKTKCLEQRKEYLNDDIIVVKIIEVKA